MPYVIVNYADDQGKTPRFWNDKLTRWGSLSEATPYTRFGDVPDGPENSAIIGLPTEINLRLAESRALEAVIAERDAQINSLSKQIETLENRKNGPHGRLVGMLEVLSRLGDPISFYIEESRLVATLQGTRKDGWYFAAAKYGLVKVDIRFRAENVLDVRDQRDTMGHWTIHLKSE